jgi:hypothetical protein
MASPRGGSTDREDTDGVRIERSAGSRRDTWLVVAGGAVVIWLVLRPVAPSPPSPGIPESRSAAAPAAEIQSPAARATSATGGDGPSEAVTGGPETRRVTGRRLEAFARRRARQILPRTRGPEGKPEAQAADAIEALRAAGITDGIAAFNPPGTDPPKAGVIVPEGVDLPEGYLRHYQTTDEGEALPPILLFHPDYDFYDDTGTRVDIPADGVVPPELVPPGIPIDGLGPSAGAPGDPATPRP